MQILLETENYFAVDKEEGDFVHPPLSQFPVPPEKILLWKLRKQFSRSVYPVHRIDAATSGIVIFSWSREGASRFGEVFRERRIEKTYWSVIRGHLQNQGEISLPLEVGEENVLAESLTLFRTMAQLELPVAVGKKYPTARYSFVEVSPRTGRWHQIRRHFDRISHPLIGDVEHGDSHHNRFFRDELQIRGLCLRAMRLAFVDPWTGENKMVRAPLNEKWSKLCKLFSISI